MKKRFDSFGNVFIGVQKQMIPHLKALIKLFYNQERKWGKLHPQCDKNDLNEKNTTFSRLKILSLSVEILGISFVPSIGITLGYLKRYVTFFYLKGLRNGSWSNLEV